MRKKIGGIFAALIAFVLFLSLPPFFQEVDLYSRIPLCVSINGSAGEMKLYWSYTDDDWSEEQAIRHELDVDENSVAKFYIPRNAKNLRLDLDALDREAKARWNIYDINISAAGTKLDLRDKLRKGEDYDFVIGQSLDEISLEAEGADPHIVFSISDEIGELAQGIASYTKIIDLALKIALALSLGLGFAGSSALRSWLSEAWGSRKLAYTLAKNDFKGRFAGSTFGVIWAFVQPIITIAVYCFVFQFGFRAQAIDDNTPYVLWLVAGMAPWIFFSEAWIGTGNALLEYKYLVQKMVFPVAVLPAIKVLSSLFVHIIFMMLLAILYALFGFFPQIYWLQLLYYLFALLFLIFALALLSAALTPIWRDTSQFIAIFTQLGFWITPIAWVLEKTVHAPWLRLLFAANPMHYIVSGYRDSLLGGLYFWQRRESIYFWALVLMLLIGSAWVFRRLKTHFADVL